MYTVINIPKTTSFYRRKTRNFGGVKSWQKLRIFRIRRKIPNRADLKFILWKLGKAEQQKTKEVSDKTSIQPERKNKKNKMFFSNIPLNPSKDFPQDFPLYFPKIPKIPSTVLFCESGEGWTAENKRSIRQHINPTRKKKQKIHKILFSTIHPKIHINPIRKKKQKNKKKLP